MCVLFNSFVTIKLTTFTFIKLFILFGIINQNNKLFLFYTLKLSGRGEQYI